MGAGITKTPEAKREADRLARQYRSGRDLEEELKRNEICYNYNNNPEAWEKGTGKRF
jgi:hypothetical protein